MSELTYEIPVVGLPDQSQDPKIASALTALKAYTNNLNMELTTVKAVVALTDVVSTISLTAKAGEFIEMTTAATSVQLPVAINPGAVIGVRNACATGTVSPVTVTTTALSAIYGDFISGASIITLMPNQHVTLQQKLDGNWMIVAGEPLRESPYGSSTPRTTGTPWIPSMSRPSFVVVKIGEGVGEMLIGGVNVGGAGSTPYLVNCSYYVAAGEKIDGSLAGVNYTSRHRLL